MGQQLLARSDAAREILRITDARVDADLATLIATGPADQLNLTEFAQPALFAIALGTLHAWRAEHPDEPDAAACAGHSIGALIAATAAGFLTVDEGARLVAERGRLMQAAPGDGSMLAIASTPAREDSLLELGARHGLAVAGHNGPRQIVLSGSRQGIDAAKAELGAKARELTVSHAFHSPMMQPAADRWSAVVSAADFQAGSIAYLRNTDGAATTDPESVRADLRDALTTPVNWTAVMTTALAFPRWISFGPSRANVSMARHMPGAPRIEVVEQ